MSTLKDASRPPPASCKPKHPILAQACKRPAEVARALCKRPQAFAQEFAQVGIISSRFRTTLPVDSRGSFQSWMPKKFARVLLPILPNLSPTLTLCEDVLHLSHNCSQLLPTACPPYDCPPNLTVAVSDAEGWCEGLRHFATIVFLQDTGPPWPAFVCECPHSISTSNLTKIWWMSHFLHTSSLTTLMFAPQILVVEPSYNRRHIKIHLLSFLNHFLSMFWFCEHHRGLHKVSTQETFIIASTEVLSPIWSSFL